MSPLQQPPRRPPVPPTAGGVVVSIAHLFSALAGIPKLDGAACVGRHELMESPEPDSITAALAVCAACEALNACRAWVRSLPPKKRPHGVVGGEIHTPVTPDTTRQRGRPRGAAVARAS
jgi:WhiB family redox-sensing transcriptional regulator